jgi:hypothetical protein
MATLVCLAVKALNYPEGGGHLWVYLNWALGFRALGCQLIWLEAVEVGAPPEQVRRQAAILKSRLERYGLGESLALCDRLGGKLSPDAVEGCLDIEAAAAADVLINLRYDMGPGVLARFKKTVLLDIDPGLLQVWMTEGHLPVARHHMYFSIGETVGQPGCRFPDAGLTWHYTPPSVAVDWWPVQQATGDAPFTTVSHWSAAIEWVVYGQESYANDKRAGFLPFLDLPRHARHPLELALCLKLNEHGSLVPYDEGERRILQEHGWRVRVAQEVTSTPWEFQAYVQQSRGEFSCAKPSCMRFQNAWISDRTLCYLASGKPAIVQHTGPSRFLPDADGLFRFRDIPEAVVCLDAVTANYDHHCRQARVLAEEYFDSPKLARRILEKSLP